MWKDLKAFTAYMEENTAIEQTEQAKEKLRKELLVKIEFFQHERLIHLIVTFMFAVCTIVSIMGFVAFQSIGIAMLFVVLMCLLVPYIVHYYHLENGVQHLYTFYDKLK